MNKLLSSLLLSVVLAPAAALACEGEEKHQTLQTLNATEGAKLVQAKAATFVDVNGAETRHKMGVIPGAILLTSTDFAATELPAAKDQKLVFYCASEQCGASKMAAKKAIASGYANVWVLPEGIKGWKASGNATAAVTPSKDQSKS